MPQARPATSCNAVSCTATTNWATAPTPACRMAAPCTGVLWLGSPAPDQHRSPSAIGPGVGSAPRQAPDEPAQTALPNVFLQGTPSTFTIRAMSTKSWAMNPGTAIAWLARPTSRHRPQQDRLRQWPGHRVHQRQDVDELLKRHGHPKKQLPAAQSQTAQFKPNAYPSPGPIGNTRGWSSPTRPPASTEPRLPPSSPSPKKKAGGSAGTGTLCTQVWMSWASSPA